VRADRREGCTLSEPRTLARGTGRPSEQLRGGAHSRLNFPAFCLVMKLDALLSQTSTVLVDGASEVEIRSIAYDSRKAGPGSLFVALKGEKVDGTQFVTQAVENGAEAVVSEQGVAKSRATSVVVPDARVALADLAAAFYQHPSRHLKVAGITGTNGKTTTAFLIKHICDHALLRAGLIGTIRYQIADEILPAARTTPESLDVQELLWKMRSAGCKSVAMEISSHAMVQHRVRKVEFDAAIFTNLTQDHLDYHKTMDAYFEAKSLLFKGLTRQLHKKGQAVINLDDRYGSQLIQRYGNDLPIISYGVGLRADFRASNIRSDFNGTSYQLDAAGKSFLVRLPLIGQFNVYNSLAAIAGAYAMGVDVRTAVLALANAPSVPGRLEAVAGQRNFKVFVDYAHTDDALVNVMKTLRELQPAKLIVVFGCGGNRDRSKRPRMGAAVDQYADYAIVTSDNPRK
ncbi:MAG: UDP-N-acetylmuramoyl-L-alanyl-D-glutamate--2,6-diaminopimelate ligase, partial [Verrucomicrobiaceae bacterium]